MRELLSPHLHLGAAAVGGQAVHARGIAALCSQRSHRGLQAASVAAAQRHRVPHAQKLLCQREAEPAAAACDVGGPPKRVGAAAHTLGRAGQMRGVGRRRW